MSRLAAAGFVALTVAIGMVAYRIAQPSHLYVEANNRDLLETMAAGMQAQADALTPTKTPYHSPTATKTPRPHTSTPLPTYAADASPGVYVVPMWTPIPPVASTQDAGTLPPCRTVTPHPYEDIACGVGG